MIQLSRRSGHPQPQFPVPCGSPGGQQIRVFGQIGHVDPYGRALLPVGLIEGGIRLAEKIANLGLGGGSRLDGTRGNGVAGIGAATEGRDGDKKR